MATRPAPSSGQTTRDKHLLDTEYSQRSRLLIGLANDLTTLGGEKFELDIPRVTFIGNQSAGKSSLVEAATGIAVPRDSEACTRCPMQCTIIRSAGPWSCTITLRFLYDEKGNDLKTTKEVSFPTIYDPKDVELWLRRAQAAILTPQADHKGFFDKTREELKGLQAVMHPFSWNKVEVLVRDPDGTDLSFVDLPGIIQHHMTDPEVVPFVKKLTERYIKNENTLIVVTVPTTDDLENQAAFELANQEDPRGTRTIGVGTKPDMLTPENASALDKWNDTLGGTTRSSYPSLPKPSVEAEESTKKKKKKGKKTREGRKLNLRHGYYCVKLPTDQEREQRHSRAELEKLEKAFFSSTEPWKSLHNQSRLGMRNFVESTSSLLIGLIEKNLPDIKRRVESLLDKEKRLLSRLPEPFTSKNPISDTLLRVMAFCKTLQGTIDGTRRKDFVHKNQTRYNTFRTEIKNTAPDLISSGSPPTQGISSTQSTMKLRPLGPIYVSEVHETIQSHRTWELPEYVSFEATKEIILHHIEHWEDPLTRCFDDISKNTLNLISSLVREPEHFGRFAEFICFVEAIIKQEETALRSQVSGMLKKNFNMENGSPLRSENLEQFNEDRSTWLNQVYDIYNSPSYSDEHKVMADVHAYFQIASARFIDVVVLCIEAEWHNKLVVRLEQSLIEKVCLLPRERLDLLLYEDPPVSKQRTDINRKITQLSKIKKRLAEYEAETWRRRNRKY